MAGIVATGVTQRKGMARVGFRWAITFCNAGVIDPYTAVFNMFANSGMRRLRSITGGLTTPDGALTPSGNSGYTTSFNHAATSAAAQPIRAFRRAAGNIDQRSLFTLHIAQYSAPSRPSIRPRITLIAGVNFINQSFLQRLLTGYR